MNRNIREYKEEVRTMTNRNGETEEEDINEGGDEE